MTEQPRHPLNETATPHHLFQQAAPRWLGDATPARRSTLAHHGPTFADWYKNANEAQHKELKRLNGEAWTAQNRLDKAMSALQSPGDFGAALLQQALKDQYGIEHDVRTTWLRLYTRTSTIITASTTGSVSWLDAALHNFEASETRADAFEQHSCFTTQPTATGQYEVLTAVAEKISIAQFIALCRELDIGGQYKRYLDDYLDLSNPVAETALRHWSRQSQLASFKLALYTALLKQDLSQTSYDALHSLITHHPSPANGCRPLKCYAPLIMSSRLTGVVLFAEDLDESREVVPVIAYIPHDPQHPIKEYASTRDFVAALTHKLRCADYQRFFSRFVDHAELGLFFSDLNQRLSQVTWHRHTPGERLPSWRETAVRRPNLQVRAQQIREDLFTHVYQLSISKLFNDARSQAISTAAADQKARWERWALIKKIGAVVLQVALFIAVPFVPPLGLTMLGYSAYQLLDDAFEGIIDWAEGMKLKAFEHAMSFIEQLVQLGMFAAGVPIAEQVLRKVLPDELWQFFERLKPVSRPNGNTRLWHPDLTPYRHDVKLPTNARPDAQGLHRYAGKPLLPLENQHFSLHQDSVSGRYSILHPSRLQAYRPAVLTNGQGAWITELDRPLSWDTRTLMRRLGHQTDGLTDSQLEHVRLVSDTHTNALRKMHITQQTPPPLLADVLKRFKIDQELHDFIAQMSSDDPAVYRQAEPQTQLQLLTSYGQWPDNKTLRFIDNAGKTLWEFKRESDASVVQIHDAQLRNGDLLRVLVESLDEADRKTLLEEPSGTPPSSTQNRTRHLRKNLARIAQDKRFALFDSRYRGLEHARNPRVQKIIDAAPTPGLPTSIAEELLAGSTSEELQAIDLGPMPKRLVELARLAQQEVRVTRAYEGLYLESVDVTDTHQLALHSLENLPGWSPQIRLEVRQYHRDGLLLDSIGPQDAPLKRTLVATAQGNYTPEDDLAPLSSDTDFYTAILQALPDTQRDALNIHIGQGSRLRQAITEHTLSRQHLRHLFDAAPPFKTPYDPTVMRLRGGMDGYRAGEPQAGTSRELTLEQRAQDLMPTLSPEQIRDVVQTLHSRPGGALAALVSLKNEYVKLDIDLAVWEASTPRLHPVTQRPLTAYQYEYAQHNRAVWAQRIRSAWRQEAEVDNYYEPPARNGQILLLRSPLLGELPQLTARFEHISSLELVGSHTPLQVNTFLQMFPNLRRLALRNMELRQFPSPIPSLPALNELILNDCQITLTDESLLALNGLTQLRTLDLSSNPLGLHPSLENMPDLRHLNLSNTGITEVPQGVLDRPTMDLILLSQNEISELPASLFDLPAELSKKVDLSNNPLSRTSLERLKLYCQATDEHWSASIPKADLQRLKNLYPTLTETELGHIYFKLPGDLAAATAEIGRLADEWRQLQDDLEEWTQNVPEREPLLDTVLDSSTRAEEQLRRRHFKTLLEQSWRRESALDDSNHAPRYAHKLVFHGQLLGDLPTLRARFDAITLVELIGEGTNQGVDGLLKCLPNLRDLTVDQHALGKIPEPIFAMEHLRYLTLSDNHIRLPPQQADLLTTLKNLEYLDLSDNPLGREIDVSNLTRLQVIHLHNCGLRQLPTGVFNLAHLQILDVSDNDIQHLPSDLLEMPMPLDDNSDISGNPLSAESIELLGRYYRQTGYDLGVEEVSHDAQGNPLTPPSTPEQMEQ